jgi:hypothetical protein
VDIVVAGGGRSGIGVGIGVSGGTGVKVAVGTGAGVAVGSSVGVGVGSGVGVAVGSSVGVGPVGVGSKFSSMGEVVTDGAVELSTCKVSGGKRRPLLTHSKWEVYSCCYQ